MIIVPSLSLPHPDRPPHGDREPQSLIHDWEWLGFRSVHLIEPSPAEHRSLNRRQVEELLRDIHIDVQVAGAIHSADDVDALLQAGASRVVLGPRAIDEPEWLSSTASAFPDSLVVETAARERRIRARGFVRTLPVDVLDLVDELASLPLAGLLIRFGPDAALDHADLALVEDLVERSDFPIQVIGGTHSVGTLRDLEFRGAAGVIIAAERLADAMDEQTLARSFVD